eukprot:2276551-Rhodomonas_salina.4
MGPPGLGRGSHFFARVGPPTVPRARYAMSGTVIGACYAMSGTGIGACYAVSGTKRKYAAIRRSEVAARNQNRYRRVRDRVEMEVPSYALSGTDKGICYALATRCLVLIWERTTRLLRTVRYCDKAEQQGWREELVESVVQRVLYPYLSSYAAATRCPVLEAALCGTDLSYPATIRCAMCGTGTSYRSAVGYVATSRDARF